MLIEPAPGHERPDAVGKVQAADERHEYMAHGDVHHKLEDIDQKPRDPAVPLLQGGEQLRGEDKHSHAGVEIRNRVGGELAREHHAPEQADEPAPYPGKGQDSEHHDNPLSPAQHPDLESLVVL